MTSTTLHNGNIPSTEYDNVMFIRKLMCKENMPASHEYKFCNYSSYNKENSIKNNK